MNLVKMTAPRAMAKIWDVLRTVSLREDLKVSPGQFSHNDGKQKGAEGPHATRPPWE